MNVKAKEKEAIEYIPEEIRAWLSEIQQTDNLDSCGEVDQFPGKFFVRLHLERYFYIKDAIDAFPPKYKLFQVYSDSDLDGGYSITFMFQGNWRRVHGDMPKRAEA